MEKLVYRLQIEREREKRLDETKIDTHTKKVARALNLATFQYQC